MKKKLTVDLTLSWSFDEKEWSQHKDHIECLKADPKQVLGYDIIHTLFCLNDITQPENKEIKVYAAD
jgi:hypothetical protein